MPRRVDRERVLPEAARDLATVLGDQVRSVAVYGSAAGPDFRPRHSDVNLVVVLERLEFIHMQRAAQWCARWRAQRFAAPLLLSATDIARSSDVFPLEFLDMQARHHTLIGADPFDGLTFPPEAVRAECERETKGKLIRLRELYLELAGSTRELRALMIDARKTFVLVMRGLLHLRGEAWTEDERAVVQSFERRYDSLFPTLSRVTEASLAEPLEARFADYLAEMEQLAVLADREARRP